MVNLQFYELFADYEYVLVYQLDCLVFADRLNEFCRLDYDYIAPPINRRSDGHWPTQDIVGVGGFSLRKVSAFSNVLHLLARPEFEVEANSLRGRIATNGAEDMFWSLSAQKIDPQFTVADIRVATDFGFNGNPRDSQKRAKGQQPFGAHKWNRLSYFIWYLRWLRHLDVTNPQLFLSVSFELALHEARLFRARPLCQDSCRMSDANASRMAIP